MATRLPLWDYKKHGKTLEGTYVGSAPFVGRFKNVQYFIKDKSGKTWATWAYFELRERFQLLVPPRRVRIVWLGMKKSKKGHMTNKFKVKVWRDSAAKVWSDKKRKTK